MHEQGLINDIMNKIIAEAQKHKAKQVLKVKVCIGQLSHFTPESFREHFYHAAAGTLAAQATLETAIFPSKAQCLNCKAEFEFRAPQTSCPICQSADFTIITGKEVLVESVELA